MCGIPSWAKKNPQKWEQIEFNKNYLKGIESEHGSLHCEYCGKEDLIIYEWYEKRDDNVVATVDHFLPSSKYQNLKKDPNNFVVSCYSCNNKKRDDIWEVETIKYPIINNKKQILTELNYVRD
jgi:5-methylcytosine-specific restriction endonuclease McrA